MTYPRRKPEKSPAMTKAYKRTSLGMVLIFRECLDSIDVAGLARSHGADIDDVHAAIATEKERRLTLGRV